MADRKETKMDTEFKEVMSKKQAKQAKKEEVPMDTSSSSFKEPKKPKKPKLAPLSGKNLQVGIRATV